METLLNKDRIKEVNPYMFEKILSKIEDNKRVSMPLWVKITLKTSIGLSFLLMIFNLYTFLIYPNRENINKELEQEIVYNKTIEENSIDALSSLYPVEFLKQTK
ncbi:MAG: hypothetical protein LBM25_02900 [Bacteroidales bacterium]|jgi:hypothetical protein|nr:hypothetical protein [Bacteroidales bacterium]